MTVEAILEATAQILLTEGVDRLSTNRIARRAGVSVGSLYQYFSSKEAIIVALSEQHLDELSAIVLAELATFDAGVEGFPELSRRLIKVMLTAHQHHPELHQVLIRLIPPERLSAVKRTITDAVAGYMLTQISALRIRDPGLAAFVMVEMVDGVVHAATLDRTDLLVDDRLVDELTDVVLRYVLP